MFGGEELEQSRNQAPAGRAGERAPNRFACRSTQPNPVPNPTGCAVASLTITTTNWKELLEIQESKSQSKSSKRKKRYTDPLPRGAQTVSPIIVFPTLTLQPPSASSCYSSLLLGFIASSSINYLPLRTTATYCFDYLPARQSAFPNCAVIVLPCHGGLVHQLLCPTAANTKSLPITSC